MHTRTCMCACICFCVCMHRCMCAHVCMHTHYFLQHPLQVVSEGLGYLLLFLRLAYQDLRTDNDQVLTVPSTIYVNIVLAKT